MADRPGPESESFELLDEPIHQLARHGEISIAFLVDHVLDVSEAVLGDSDLVERPADAPWVKDYDMRGGGPARWVEQFDISQWGLIGAYIGRHRVGGVVIAWNSPEVNLFEDRSDLAYVWDIRVAPTHRGLGIGTSLFQAASRWAQECACIELRVETQNINVSACHFYRRMSCALASVNRTAYADHPGEVQLIWHRELWRKRQTTHTMITQAFGNVPSEWGPGGPVSMSIRLPIHPSRMLG